MKAHVTMTVEVEIEVNDPDVLKRVTGPEGDEWRAHLYAGIRTEADVLNHLAFNCVQNDVWRVNRLDGWADLPDDAATMRLASVDPLDVASVS